MHTWNSTLPWWFDHIESTISYSLMLATLVTIPLYVVEIMIMLTLRKTCYKGMFYRIFTIGAVVDMVALMNNYIGCVFPARGWFSSFYHDQGGTVGQIYLLFAWCCRGVQACTVVALALNRATAVCLPLQHKVIWNSKWTRVLYVVQTTLVCSIASKVLTQKFYWKKLGRGYYVQFYDRNFRYNFFVFAYCVETCLVISIIVINLTMLIMFKRKYRLVRRHENNLTVVSIVTCAIEIVYYCYILYAFGINTQMNKRVFYLFYDCINFVYSGLSAWLILRYSKPMRMHMDAVFRCVQKPSLAIKKTVIRANESSTIVTSPPRKSTRYRSELRSDPMLESAF